ncbi:serine/threonine-protein kinase [Actinomadura sp. 7K507]|uniref:serine/threonine-protein kinase n=1 Tax=Actinomadura sp. 7K507 TaxID=2530365 RepID=UPI0010EF1056|nr:serine/threonine-protein kinase [Actinomadura sp. 7K507]TDC80538.1 serine/threonine protein kinase [Actinomadura sp. 7K507]
MSSEHRLPGFVELAELGSGAQGEVVLARHESGGGPVAIKYLATGLLGDTAARNTFRDEAQMLKRVVNPHVARLLEYLESPWGAAIILEAVAGRPLRKVLDEHDGPLTPEAALTTLKGSLLGLAAAHAVGVVHRDYKPANVLVQDDGQSKLIDFGIAVLTGQSGRAGTPVYMAPEQWAGEPATPATDLYAATCVFVECVSGEKPFHAKTPDALKAEHNSAPPPLERVPEPLRPLVERGMAKSPSDRIWNAYEFVNELETIAVQTYGPDWERRGIVALGVIAATVTTTVPLAILGGAILAPGAAGTTTAAGTAASSVVGPASAMYSQGAATADVMTKVGSSTSKGFLGKLGGAKGATGIGAAGVGAAIIAWFFWPASPTVGGTSQGTVHGYFTNPGALLGQPSMPAAETPYMNLKLTVTPARAKPGTTMRMMIEFSARTPKGAKYWPNGSRQCFGETEEGRQQGDPYEFAIGTKIPTKHKNWVAFYRIPPTHPQELPKKKDATIVGATGGVSGEHQPYVWSECATMSEWTEIRTFTVPNSNDLRSGKYLLSPAVPVQITGKNGNVPLESMGPVTEGALPPVELLDE